MAYVDSDRSVGRPDLVRWGACAALVLLAHGLALLALSRRSDEGDFPPGAPVVMIELAPIPVAPVAPPPPTIEPPPEPQPPQTETREQVREEPPPEQKPVELPPVPAPNPAVTLPMPEPPKPPPEPAVEPKPKPRAPVRTAPPKAVAPAPRPAAPPPGSVARPSSDAMASWQRQLVAQIDRNKRYPSGVQGVYGTPELMFSIDRRGHLVSSRIIQSCGSAVLDAEAISTIRRAQPFPAPPAGLADSQLTFRIPIRFKPESAQR